MKIAVFIVHVLVCLVWSSAGSAQGAPTYPSRTVRLVVATAAGTTADVLARVLADRASSIWRQTIIVENRAGVAGLASVAKADPDGHFAPSEPFDSMVKADVERFGRLLSR